MANSFYALGLKAYLDGGIATLSDTIKAGLWSSASYTPNLTTDQYFGIAVAGGAIIAAGVALGTKTTTAGTFSAANTLWTSVSGGAAAYVGIYKDTGTANTSPLLALFDTATGLPVTPNGGDITAAWSSGQVYTLFQGLDPTKEPGLVRALWEWFNDHLGWEVRRGRSGLWLPSPVIQLSRPPAGGLWMPEPAFA